MSYPQRRSGQLVVEGVPPPVPTALDSPGKVLLLLLNYFFS